LNGRLVEWAERASAFLKNKLKEIAKRLKKRVFTKTDAASGGGTDSFSRRQSS
jgi:hypothetical protein